MTDNTTAPGGDELEQIEKLLGHTLKLVPLSQRELFAFEAYPKVQAYILAEVLTLIGKDGLIDPNDPAGNPGASWKYNGKTELRRELRQAAIARFGKGGNRG